MFCLDGACDTNSFWQSLKILCHRQTSTRTNRKCWFPDHMEDIKMRSESFPHNDRLLNLSSASYHFYFPLFFSLLLSLSLLHNIKLWPIITSCCFQICLIPPPSMHQRNNRKSFLSKSSLAKFGVDPKLSRDSWGSSRHRLLSVPPRGRKGPTPHTTTHQTPKSHSFLDGNL